MLAAMIKIDDPAAQMTRTLPLNWP